MSSQDIDFALRSVSYLRTRGLRPSEIELVLRNELECPPEVAHRLATAA